jgi:uroporphyrinogen-III synthase
MTAGTSPSSATLPLAGKRVLVTRAGAQADELSRLLRQAGATPVESPAIEIIPLRPPELDHAIHDLAHYDWLIFTSTNAVRVFFDRFAELGANVARLRSVAVAAVGASTARAVEQRGVEVAAVPDTFVAEALLDTLVSRGIAGKCVLLPCAEAARDVLPDGLRAAGAVVEVVPTYRTALPEAAGAEIARVHQAGGVDAITFASPSSVRNFIAMGGDQLARCSVVACIGPVTAKSARDCGLQVAVEAEEHSMPGLVRALGEYFSEAVTRTASLSNGGS